MQNLSFRPVQGERTPWWIWFLIGLTVVALTVPVHAVITAVRGAQALQYELTADEFIIRFWPGDTRFERASITGANVIQTTRGVRTAGTGLPGLQTGRWRFPETGPIRLFTTSTRTLVVLEVTGGKIGISPSDPAAFVQGLQGGAVGSFAPVAVQVGGFRLWWLWATLALGLLAVAVLLYTIRAARLMTYELAETDLLIRVGYFTTRVPYRSIERVEQAEAKGTPFRILGTAMPGLYWGSFSWKALGKRVRLYSTQLRPLVVVRTGSTTYGLSPDEPERFMAELNQRCG